MSEANITDELGKLAVENGNKLDFVNKRIDIEQKNLKRLKILSPLYEEETKSSRENDIYSYIINQAIEYFYKSDEVKKRLDNV